jgi:putative lipoprotein
VGGRGARRVGQGRGRLGLGAVVLPVVFVVLAPAEARAQGPAVDPWFGPDKALHCAIEGAIAGAGYGTTAIFSQSIPTRIAFGAGLAVTAGAGKELLDLAGYGDPSWKDFVWDLAGTAVGVGIAVTFDVAFGAASLAPAR